MKKWKIGVLGTADIAFRRMLPAIRKTGQLEYYGVAVALDSERSAGGAILERAVCGSGEAVRTGKRKRAEEFVSDFGGVIVEGYEAMLCKEEVDAVYLPLPPSLHEYWAEKALEHGKHVLVEKPCTIRKEGTERLLMKAEAKGLSLYENYGFCLHNQVTKIREVIAGGQLGQLRLLRASFGFPYRGAEDFRYQNTLGGGALFDCGGYTIKAAQLFLGEKLQVKAASLMGDARHDVDLFGNITMQNQDGLCGQLAFGMDNVYQCSLELIGSKASLSAARIFSPPANFQPQLLIRSQTEETILVPADDQFQKAAEDFAFSMENSGRRLEVWEEVRSQSSLVGEVQRIAGKE